MELNPFSATEDKENVDFGLKMAKFIESDWFFGGYDNRVNWRYARKADKIRRLRSWCDGTVDKSQFKDFLNINEDFSAMAIDDTVVSFMPRYISAVVDSINNKFHRVSATGVDRYSLERAELSKDEIRKEMLFKKYAPTFEAATGVTQPVDETIPETEEELDLVAKLDFKTNYELAIEESIQKLFYLNNFDEIANLAVEDLVLHGEAVVRPDWDDDMIVKLNYVDPENYIYSYNTDRTRDMRNVFYCGEKRTVSITELQRLIGRSLSEDDLQKIKGSQRAASFQSNTNKQFTCDILDFSFKATKANTYKKKYNKGAYKILEKDSTWSPSEGYEDRKLVDSYETWYGGIYIIGTSDMLFNYRELEFLSRKRGDLKRVMTPYCHYKLSVQSMGERLEPIIRNLHILYAKMNMLISSVRAQGISIDLSRLTEVQLGNGKTLTPDELVRLYQTSSTLLWASELNDGERSQKPIEPVVVNYLTDISNLIQLEQNLFNKADRITGLTPESQGFAPTKGAGVKAYQIAAEASSVATMLFFNGWYSVVRNVADHIAARMQDAAVYGMKGQLTSLIGKQYADNILDQYFKHYAQFRVDVELKPSEEEKAGFIEMLNLAVQTSKIQPEDAALIKLELDNPQRAVQVFSVLQRRNRKKQQEQEAQMSQFQSQQKQQEIMVNQQMEAQKVQMDIESKMRLKQLEAQIEMNAKAFEWKNKLQLQMLVNKNAIIVAEIKGGIESEKEQAKLDRLYEQGTMTSQIKEQNKAGLPSIDFKQERGTQRNATPTEELNTTNTEQEDEDSAVLQGEPEGVQEEAGDGQENQPETEPDGEEEGAGEEELPVGQEREE